MFLEDDTIKSDCLWTLSYLAGAETDDLINLVSQNDILHLITECLNSDYPMLYIPALKIIGAITTSDNKEIIDRLLWCGLFDKITYCLQKQDI